MFLCIFGHLEIFGVGPWGFFTNIVYTVVNQLSFRGKKFLKLGHIELEKTINDGPSGTTASSRQSISGKATFSS